MNSTKEIDANIGDRPRSRFLRRNGPPVDKGRATIGIAVYAQPQCSAHELASRDAAPASRSSDIFAAKTTRRMGDRESH